jgi:hypothetical protein
VNHKVENHIDIEGAGREDGEAVGLEKHGAAEFGLDSEDSGVEAFEVAGLEDAVAAVGAGDEVVGFSDGGGDRLFDQHVKAGIEQRGGNGMVMHGGDGDGGRVQFEIGGEQLIDGGEDGNSVFVRGVGGAGGVRLNGGDESDTEAGGFKLAIDAKMVAAKRAGSGNGHTEDGLAGYFASSFPSTTLRQRL